jgi:ferredoxin
MRVVVNYDLCEGNGRCVDAAPEVFELRDDDRSHVLVEHPGEELRPKVERSVRLCPRQAIAIVEDEAPAPAGHEAP